MEERNKLTLEEEDRLVEDEFRDVLNGYLASNHRKKVEIIERAYRFAKEAHKGIRRRSGEPYILHPIAVAKIASQEMGWGPRLSVLRCFMMSWKIPSTLSRISSSISARR